MPKIEYKLGVTLKLRPDVKDSYDFLRIDVGVSDIDPEGDVAKQVETCITGLQAAAPAVEAEVGKQMAESGNIAVEGVGLASVVDEFVDSMRKAWKELDKRVSKLEK